VKRDRRTIKTDVVLGEPERFEYKLEEVPNVTAQQREIRTAWLSGNKN
jgi:hypothetical protein